VGVAVTVVVNVGLAVGSSAGVGCRAVGVADSVGVTDGVGEGGSRNVSVTFGGGSTIVTPDGSWNVGSIV
jgi:hypothetical protein